MTKNVGDTTVRHRRSFFCGIITGCALAFLACARVSPEQTKGAQSLPIGNTPESRLTIEPRTFTGHTSEVISLAISPDDQFILSGSSVDDFSVRLWNIASGKEVRRFLGHTGEIRTVAFSDDGHSIISGSSVMDGTVRLWDRNSGRETRRFEGEIGPASVFSDLTLDGRFVLYYVLPGSSGQGGEICVLRVDTGKSVSCLSEDTGRVVSTTVSTDGQRVVTGDDNGPIRIWDATRGTLLRRFTGKADQVVDIAISNDGKNVIVGFYDSAVQLWDVTSGQLMMTYPPAPKVSGRACGLSQVLFLPDGKRFLVASDSIRVIDLNSGRVINTFHSHDGCIESLVVSHKGDFLVSGGADRTVRLTPLP